MFGEQLHALKEGWAVLSKVDQRLSAHGSHLLRKGGISSIWQDCPSHSHSVSDSYTDRSEMGLCPFDLQETNDSMKKKAIWSYAKLMNAPFRKHLQRASVSSVCNQRKNRFPEPLDQLIQDTQDT